MTAAPQDDTAARPVGRYEWEALLLRIEIRGPVKFLALVLATHADADGTRVRPGNARLVKITGQSKATVKRNLAVIRDDLRMLLQVSRGGGRNGHGRTTEYRLAVPVDLLERVTLTPLEPTRSGLTIVSPQRDSEPVDNNNSGLTVMSPQSDDSGLTKMSPENDFQGSNTAHPESMRAQIDSLRAHPGEPLPPTRPTKKEDQHVITPPTQPTTARETDTDEIDHVELKPPKCIHGLRAHIRDDGTPKCVLCRRLAPPEEPA